MARTFAKVVPKKVVPPLVRVYSPTSFSNFRPYEFILMKSRTKIGLKLNKQMVGLTDIKI
ncbi:hypothetical protein HMPREF9078_02023 [Capnocytophaga sp. oral taxon 380 str. F0488]|nr:hypothetical protein HMPREF9078_02023 [Capnocytophaga sp. oral taxon 380 str. F0488]